jgi:hypothetical protein
MLGSGATRGPRADSFISFISNGRELMLISRAGVAALELELKAPFLFAS